DEGGRRCRGGVVRNGEDDQEEPAEHEDARQALARPPLEAQVLRQDGERAAHGQPRPTTTACQAAATTTGSGAPSCAHAMRPRWRMASRVATGAARSRSCVVSTIA